MTREFNLDEAIKHCEEIAMDKTNLAQTLWDSKEKARCEECAEEHNQLAQWLIELKILKTEQQSSGSENPNNCDLISRKALISHIEKQSREWGEDYDAQQILADIEDMSSVKPQTGHWILKIEDWNRWICSECGYTKRTDIHVSLGYDFCPKCGARMGEKQNG